ncbi:unnamed protein product [Protopolystoma xenopodis]|uniref:Uncharacterized protein n=1 Tax=Protopolystoma xenopodis TaxID=117903 RepID=A0A3S5BWX4_9PLAT|nr:unnamed protein product [Protopolystoma xenopodis]
MPVDLVVEDRESSGSAGSANGSPPPPGCALFSAGSGASGYLTVDPVNGQLLATATSVSPSRPMTSAVASDQHDPADFCSGHNYPNGSVTMATPSVAKPATPATLSPALVAIATNSISDPTPSDSPDIHSHDAMGTSAQSMFVASTTVLSPDKPATSSRPVGMVSSDVITSPTNQSGNSCIPDSSSVSTSSTSSTISSSSFASTASPGHEMTQTEASTCPNPLGRPRMPLQLARLTNSPIAEDTRTSILPSASLSTAYASRRQASALGLSATDRLHCRPLLPSETPAESVRGISSSATKSCSFSFSSVPSSTTSPLSSAASITATSPSIVASAAASLTRIGLGPSPQVEAGIGGSGDSNICTELGCYANTGRTARSGNRDGVQVGDCRSNPSYDVHGSVS